MAAKLYVVHGSHPCVTVERALELKGVPFTKVELPPPSHALVMRMAFGGRTVPAVRFDDGAKVQGSRQILAVLEERHPEPPLLPSDAAARAKVLEAERWGDEVLQHLVRQVLWPTLIEHPSAAPSFSQGAKMPLPAPVLKAAIPLVGRAELKLNSTNADVRARRLEELPGHLDHIDALMEDGVLGGSPLNRADLQIGPSLALLRTMEDIADLMRGRRVDQLAARFPTSGRIPRGALPGLAKPATSAAS